MNPRSKLFYLLLTCIFVFVLVYWKSNKPEKENDVLATSSSVRLDPASTTLVSRQSVQLRYENKHVTTTSDIPVVDDTSSSSSNTSSTTSVLTTTTTTIFRGSVWDDLAECESGGNWHLNDGSGFYGGLQFLYSTWKSVGGEGYPHEASREE